MYEELIESLSPKSKLNLKWYKNEDLYSEGDVEDDIIRLIAEYPPEDYSDAIYNNFNWSTYYHLTHLRKNILNWYPFNKDASVLEIGCGMGAITGVLCDNCKDVTSVELSKRRATATLLRCREKENLEIIVGNLNDIEFDKKFDYITLIGVLEYQGSYTETSNPYGDFLSKIKNLLAPNGKLFIAIENQYGLKYWCGAREDHTGIPFEGMNQYTLSQKKVRTFSKADLDKLIKESGFKNTYFYYPMPDYKLPTVIYSENHLPQNENMQNLRCYYAPTASTLVSMEQPIYKDIIANNVFEFFSNSFLVECTDADIVGEVPFASISSERLPEYRICTRFDSDGMVEKFPLYKELGAAHIRQIFQNEQNLTKQNINVLQSTLEDNTLTLPYTDAPLLENCLLDAYKKKQFDTIYALFDKVYSDILHSSEIVDWSENILYTFDLNITANEEKYGPILKIGYLDMILRNAFLIDDELYWFDQEWILENVPAKYVLYRAITQFYASYPELLSTLSLREIATHYELTDIWDTIQIFDKLFMDVVIDSQHLATSNVFRSFDPNTHITNINKLLKA